MEAKRKELMLKVFIFLPVIYPVIIHDPNELWLRTHVSLCANTSGNLRDFSAVLLCCMHCMTDEHDLARFHVRYFIDEIW